jgi:hypothetical protein
MLGSTGFPAGFSGFGGGQQMMQPMQRPQTPTMQRPEMPLMQPMQQQQSSPWFRNPQQQQQMPSFMNHVQGQLPSFDQLSAQYPSFFQQHGIGQDQFNQISNWWGQRPQGGDMGSWWQARPSFQGLSRG